MSNYIANPERYNSHLPYQTCGKSGLQLPKISLGMWHGFGDADNANEAEKILKLAFDSGISHFDLANVYGNPAGSAEALFGKMIKKNFSSYRNEMIISTKAGHSMWKGRYGEGGSRKHIFASLHDSLQRLNLDYVDIFYSHIYDSNTPLEETVNTLSDIVKQGKVLYIGLSKYPADKARQAYNILRELNTPCIVHQDRYNLLNRSIEKEILPQATEKGVGFIAFSPLAQGCLSDKYLKGIPNTSRAANPSGFLQKSEITDSLVKKVTNLNEFALKRGQTLPQMALAWCLQDSRVSSVLVGVSSTKQLKENLKALDNSTFTEEELWLIGEIADK